LKKAFSILATIVLISLIIPSCGESDTKSKKNNNYLPEAKGAVAEILVVMDSVRWNGAIGRALKRIFYADIPGIPQDEKRFKVLYVHPDNFKTLLKRHRNLLFVTSLEDKSNAGQIMRSYFNKDALDKIKSDSSLFMISKDDVYGRGQKFLHLFAQTDDQLIEKIEKYQESIYHYFYDIEIKRLAQGLLSMSEQEKLSDYLYKKYGFKIRIPASYELAKEEEGFIWLRQMGEPADKSIIISYQPYVSQKMFNDEEFVKMRDSIGYAQINDKSIDSSYMATDVLNIPLYSKSFSWHNVFAREYRGIWYLKNKTRGGAFLSYALVDQKKNRFYYIEGFLYAPSTEKRRYLMELEAILKGFEFGK